MKRFAVSAGIVCAAGVMLFAAQGCDGCSCGKRPAPVVVENPTVSGQQPSTDVTEPPTSPVRADLMVEGGMLIPLDVSSVVVFEPVRLRDALHKVARVAPKLVRAMDYKDIRDRIMSLYGVDMAVVEGPCLFAVMSDGNKLLVCKSSGEVTVPPGAEIWKVGAYQGPIITRRNHKVSLGLVKDHLIAGDSAAVFKAVNSFVNGQPSFGLLAARKSGLVADLSADDSFRDTAMFFVSKSRPQWCPEAVCAGTAVFGGPDRFVVVSIADGPEGVKQLQSAMEEAWRKEVMTKWEQVKADVRLPEEYLKAAEASVGDHSVRIRENRVIMDVKGDIFDLLSVVRIADLDWFLGE